MNPFDTSGDLYTHQLDQSMAAACEDARALVDLLNVDSYTQVGPRQRGTG